MPVTNEVEDKRSCGPGHTECNMVSKSLGRITCQCAPTLTRENQRPSPQSHNPVILERILKKKGASLLPIYPIRHNLREDNVSKVNEAGYCKPTETYGHGLSMLVGRNRNTR